MDILRLILVAVGAMTGGAVNSVAGGGTVFNFTGLVAYGLPTVNANATNATALAPGSLGAAVAMRHELRGQLRTLAILLVPTVAGSLLGAIVVANSPEAVFRRIVPFLIMFATLVFALRNRFTRWAKRRESTAAPAGEREITPLGYALGICLQFLISFYGGYFGAGIGILMLTSLSVMGLVSIHKMNAIKNLLAVSVNVTAMFYFIRAGTIVWPMALFAAVFAIVGGYGLGRYARRINPDHMRWGVVVAGVVVSIWMFVRSYLLT
jgi:hypothetical protein